MDEQTIKKSTFEKVIEFCLYFGEDTLDSILTTWKDNNMDSDKLFDFALINVSKHIGIPRQCILTKYSQHQYKKYAIGLIVLYVYEHSNISFTILSKKFNGVSRSLLYTYKNSLEGLSPKIPIEKHVIEQKIILDEIIKEYTNGKEREVK